MSMRKHSHYFRWVGHLRELDIYRVLDLFGVTDHAIGHAIKKLMLPGMRGGGKPTRKDIEEAIDTLQRKLEMMDEDAAAVDQAKAEQPWLDWGPGYEHPITDVLVDVRQRNGIEVHGLMANRVRWVHFGLPTDIVAYRVNHGG